MTKEKLSKAEKLLVKALIEWHREIGVSIRAQQIEIEMWHITDKRNMEHRLAVEDYAQSCIQAYYEKLAE